MKIVDVNGNSRECIKIFPDVDWPGYMRAEIIDRRGTHMEWFSTAEFIKLNPDLKYLAKGAPEKRKEDLGVVSASKSNSLIDRKKAWEKDIFVGTPVWISRGKGEGQTRTIVSNTKNTLIVNRAWDILPDNSSQYLISMNIHMPKIFSNSLLAQEQEIAKSSK